MRLTTSLVRAARPRAGLYALYDALGLCLQVTRSGSKWWRYRYRFAREARQLHADARGMLARGVDSSAERNGRRAARHITFNVAARSWLTSLEPLVRTGRLTADTVTDSRRLLERRSAAVAPGRKKSLTITGAARGIGAAVVSRFKAEGAQVISLDRQPVPTTVDGVLNLTADVTNAEQVAVAVATTLKHFGRIDALINNAGVNVFGSPLLLSDHDWDRCLDVDLKGAWVVSKAVLPTLLTQKSGSIVNIASIHGHKIVPGCFPYPVAKHGLIGLTRALAIEYAAHGVRVNSISPGFILTPQTEEWLAAQPDPAPERRRQEALLPCKRLGTAQEVAYTALFLASDEARFINAADILIDGGRSQLYHE